MMRAVKKVGKEGNNDYVSYEKMGNGTGAGGTKKKGATVTDRWKELHRLKFLVTEKIHGANFAIQLSASNGNSSGSSSSSDSNVTVRFGKRTGLLEEYDDFYSCRSTGLTHRLSFLAKNIFQTFLAQDASRDNHNCVMTIYGELFGGYYPQAQIESITVPLEEMCPVQSGIWYSPNLEFMAFDVAIEEEDTCGAYYRYYMDFDVAKQLVESGGIRFVDALFRGSFEECMDYPLGFDSSIPATLGLVPLPNGSNAAEGVVVRSESSLLPPRTKQNGSEEAQSSESVRWVSKRKTRAFQEKKEVYQDEGLSRMHREARLSNPPQREENDAHTILTLEALAMCTRQRLDNVLSKIGRLDSTNQKMCRQVLRALYDDIMEEMREEFGLSHHPSPEAAREIEDECKRLIIALAKEQKENKRKVAKP